MAIPGPTNSAVRPSFPETPAFGHSEAGLNSIFSPRFSQTSISWTVGSSDGASN
jgi:hypothetical protein